MYRDINNDSRKITAMQKTPVPGMGYFAVCIDTENNTFAIWETDDSAK
jgi:predicted enzyme related to lactoylglutathione lyase